MIFNPVVGGGKVETGTAYSVSADQVEFPFDPTGKYWVAVPTENSRLVHEFREVSGNWVGSVEAFYGHGYDVYTVAYIDAYNGDYSALYVGTAPAYTYTFSSGEFSAGAMISDYGGASVPVYDEYNYFVVRD